VNLRAPEDMIGRFVGEAPPMTISISDVFLRIRAQQRMMPVNLPVFRCLRLGGKQGGQFNLELSRELRSVDRAVIQAEGVYAGLRFYVDPAFDGIEVEVVEPVSIFPDMSEIRRICSSIGVGCRAY
jgi:hypothetical protein